MRRQIHGARAIRETMNARHVIAQRVHVGLFNVYSRALKLYGNPFGIKPILYSSMDLWGSFMIYFRLRGFFASESRLHFQLSIEELPAASGGQVLESRITCYCI